MLVKGRPFCCLWCSDKLRLLSSEGFSAVLISAFTRF